jgi:prepilin-type N-terminal cleavage/methylation domain-containing protein
MLTNLPILSTTPLRTTRREPTGFSLVELLVASSIALVVMGAIAQLFSMFGRTMSQSQATVDLSGRIRTAAWQLRQDLAGVTADLVPWNQPESNSGYFEILEGPVRDASFALAGGVVTGTLSADTDDSLFFTTRSAGDPFVGRFGAGTIEAPCAEVAWFCREAGDQPIAGTTLYNLHRRQLLVVGYVGTPPFSTGNNNSAPVASLMQAGTPVYDLSLRLDGADAFPNTLGDLTKRENRCFLGGNMSIRSTAFPYAVLTDALSRVASNATFDNTDRVWEDVILTNVIAFDVRVYDPQAKAQNVDGTTLYPGDPSYNAGAATGASGAYVDLGWGGGAPVAISGTFPPSGITAFQSAGVLVSNAPGSATLPVTTYDTWSLHYEFNGENEDADAKIDEGTDGIDDNGDSLPDNSPESETSPPYPVPLKGLEVRIRCYEPTSKQVRQVTVVHSFESR